MSVETQIEQALTVSEKDLASTLCVIRAIYRLSYQYYLKVNGFTENDLKKDGGVYRKLQTWPSQSRFIFSLEQMRDAYERLGKNPVAKLFMTQQAIDESQKRNRSKEGFWTLLGDAESAFESFRILENDDDYDAEKLYKLRLQSYAFRLVLFQTKISEFRETGNFLALLNSANREFAQEAFRDCASIVPLPASFYGQQNDENENNNNNNDCNEIEANLRRQLQEKDDQISRYQKSLQEMIEIVNKTVSDMQETKIFTKDIAELLQQSLAQQTQFCEQIKISERA